MIDTHRRGDPKDKYEFREVVANLSATLTELGIAHDWVTLFEVADELKTTPGLSKNELEILETATTQAIEAAVEGEGSARLGRGTIAGARTDELDLEEEPGRSRWGLDGADRTRVEVVDDILRPDADFATVVAGDPIDRPEEVE